MSGSQKKTKSKRHSLYAKINIGKKELGWDEDQYRTWLLGNFGGESLSNLTISDLESALDLMKAAGFKPKRKTFKRRSNTQAPVNAQVYKARALWHSLYNLGVVRDNSDEAFLNQAKRIVIGTKGKENVVFTLNSLNASRARKLVEGLKAWAKREGVNWAPYVHVVKGEPEYRENPRCRVIEAQWEKISDRNEGALSNYVTRFFDKDCKVSHMHLSEAECDQLIKHFGEQIRKGMEDGLC